MLKSKRSLKEMTDNLSKLRGEGGYSVPVRSPLQLQEEQYEEREIDKVKSLVDEMNKKIDDLPKLEDIQREFKHGGKSQLELRDIKGARLDSFTKDSIRYHIEELMHGGGGSGTGGGGFQPPTGGNVDGINRIFTFATAPNILSVDAGSGGRVIRQVQSDGTINWTGTTTITLAIAPNYDIFALG